MGSWVPPPQGSPRAEAGLVLQEPGALWRRDSKYPHWICLRETTSRASTLLAVAVRQFPQKLVASIKLPVVHAFVDRNARRHAWLGDVSPAPWLSSLDGTQLPAGLLLGSRGAPLTGVAARRVARRRSQRGRLLECLKPASSMAASGEAGPENQGRQRQGCFEGSGGPGASLLPHPTGTASHEASPDSRGRDRNHTGARLHLGWGGSIFEDKPPQPQVKDAGWCRETPNSLTPWTGLPRNKDQRTTDRSQKFQPLELQLI